MQNTSRAKFRWSSAHPTAATNPAKSRPDLRRHGSGHEHPGFGSPDQGRHQGGNGVLPPYHHRHLHRSKLDPNREIIEAAQGDPESERAWWEFQTFIEEATETVEGSTARGSISTSTVTDIQLTGSSSATCSRPPI